MIMLLSLSNPAYANWCLDPNIVACWPTDTDEDPVQDASTNNIDLNHGGSSPTYGSTTPDPPNTYSDGYYEYDNAFNEYLVTDEPIFLESISTYKIPDKLDLLQFAGARDVSELERIYLFQKQEKVDK